MRYVAAGDDLTIVAPFKAGLDFAAPDAGTVMYTLYDNTGTAIVDQTDIQVDVASGANQAPILLDRFYHTVANGLLFEKRRLDVNFLVSGQPYRYRESYRVTAALPINTDQNDVRRALGLSTTELPDDDIDVVEAYFDLSEKFIGTTLRDALISGTHTALVADRAIAYQAALNLIASLPLRILQQESTGTNKYARFLTLDLDSLSRNIASLLDDATTTLTGVTAPLPQLVVAGGRTDPVTGQ